MYSAGISDLERRAARHGAVADVARLAVVDELVRGDRSPSELQELLGIPSNLLAHHLKVLEAAEIVVRHRSEGDRRRTYLTLIDVTAAQPPPHLFAPRVVFVCTGNAARSQLAAALWHRSSDVPVASAGTTPGPGVASGAVEVAARHGLDLSAARTHGIGEVLRPDDLLVAVCDRAYERIDRAVELHWSVADPVRVGTTGAFDASFADLNRRVAALSPQVLVA